MRSVVELTLCVAALAALSTAAQDKGPVTKTTYLVVYRAGPGWVAGKPLAEQPLADHGKYMLSLYAKGVLKFAGPFLDNSGGAVVLEAANESEAKAVVAADPAIVSQVFVGDLHPWRLVDWEKRQRSQ